jgi:hypothetical protein
MRANVAGYNLLIILIITLSMIALSNNVLAQPTQSAAKADGQVNDQSFDERIQQQEQQIRELRDRLRQLESSAMSEAPQPKGRETEERPSTTSPSTNLGAVRDTTGILSGAELVSDEFPASWPMFGTDMRMKIGGYIKADFVYDFDGTLDKNQFLMSTIPVEGTPEADNDPYVAFFAQESRINLDIRRIKPGAPPLRGFIEGDFFDDENQFRLRHAYITAGNFLVGQTWTTLSFLESLPFTIDFAAGDALFGGRTTQVRYTKTINDRWKFALALEDLQFLGIENPNNLPGQATTQLPLVAIRADYRWDTGVLFLGSSVAQLHWDGGATGPSSNAMQIDGVIAGRQIIGRKSFVTWNVSYGEGSGENILAFAGSNANAVLTVDGKLDTMPAFSILLGFGHEWTQQLSSNLSYAYGWLDTPDSRAPFALKRGGIGHINLIWKPAEHFSTGVEFMWGAQRTQNDAKGDASRIQFMAKFDF